MQVRKLIESDFQTVQQIYQFGIDTGLATFETIAPDWRVWDQKFLQDLRLVIGDDKNEVIGWAALSAVSDRCVYAGVCETSCYVHPAHWGKGLGQSLLRNLIRLSEERNIWTLQAGIFPENLRSVRVHLKNGFREVGYRESIGKLNGHWKNVMLLERRSHLAGRD